MLAFKACQLLAMYRNDLSKFFSHASSMVESLSSLQSTAAQRFKTLFEQMLQDLFDEKEVPDPDLLPTSSILTLTTQLRELTQLHHQFPWPNETELKSILDAIIDPCLQYSIVVVQNLEHTQASIFLLNCFVEIKNSISTFFENKAATIENQIEIYVDSLVSEMVSFMETESGFSSLLTEVQALSSDNTLVHSGWTLQDIQNILVRLDTFLMDVHGVLPLNKLLSSELATRIRRNAAHLFLEDYRLVYEAIKSPKNGDSYSSLKLRTPDIIASILID
ncbi:Golgi transport complex subunit 6 [Coelomomyces lativittatus]|nr:Golgi transport complex subunit 6 [Coelomomyces lativittatus]